MRAIPYVVTVLGCVAGGFFLFMALTAAESAPQEASLAAIAVAFAVIPYCFARAIAQIEDAEIASDLRAIADHYRRVDAEASRARMEESRRATEAHAATRSGGPRGGVGSPFASMGGQR